MHDVESKEPVNLNNTCTRQCTAIALPHSANDFRIRNAPFALTLQNASRKSRFVETSMASGLLSLRRCCYECPVLTLVKSLGIQNLY